MIIGAVAAHLKRQKFTVLLDCNVLCHHYSAIAAFSRCYGWGVTSGYLFKIGDFAPTGVSWPKISRRRGPPANHSFSHKTTL